VGCRISPLSIVEFLTRLLLKTLRLVFGTVGVNDVFDFIDSGHNVIMALGSEVSETMRFLAGDCGVDLDDKSTRVIDHFQYAVTDGAKLDHSLIAATDILNSTVVLGSGIKVPTKC
jgi:oligosaccharyltransferase complex subunit beta